MSALPPAAAAPTAPNVHAVRMEEVFYPSSDGKPMAENMWQSRAILHAAGDLEAARPRALVAADILVYPEEGNNKNAIAPDVLVALELGTESRASYFVWKEGKPPDWVLEVASPSTQAEDRGGKWHRYAAMGVPEYWLFDPKGDVYPRGTPRLQGLQLVEGEYAPLPSLLADGARLIRSRVLGLDVRVEGELLRFRDATTGRDIPHRPEVAAAAAHAQASAKHAQASVKRAQAHAERESARRKTAEARVAQLEAALRRSQGSHPP